MIRFASMVTTVLVALAGVGTVAAGEAPPAGLAGVPAQAH